MAVGLRCPALCLWHRPYLHLDVRPRAVGRPRFSAQANPVWSLNRRDSHVTRLDFFEAGPKKIRHVFDPAAIGFIGAGSRADYATVLARCRVALQSSDFV